MTSTPTMRLRLDKQGTGDNPDNWGQRLNETLDLIDESFGFAEIAVNGPVTLAVQNFASDQARRMILRFTGAGGFPVTVPTLEKMYYIDNRCTADVTLKTANTPGSAVVAGTKRIAYCDGATITTDTSASAPPASAVSVAPAGGIQSTNTQDALQELDAEKARLDGAAFTGAISAPTISLPSVGSSYFAAGNGDAATYATFNARLHLHSGLGIETYDGTVKAVFDSRAGFWDTKGAPRVNGQAVWYPGNFDPATKLDKAGGALGGQIVAKASVGGGLPSRSGDGSFLQVRADEGQGAAAMTFHRANSYATWFGLDTDNEFKFGGWSEGAIAHRFWTSKNFNPASYLPLTGGTVTGDVTVYRPASPGTGVLFLGNSGARYVFYDGSNYVMPGANLFVNGSQVMTTANTYDKATGARQDVNNIPSFNASAIDIVRGGVLRARWTVDSNGTTILQNGDNGDNFFYVTTGGGVWTKQFGDLNARIEDRAYAWASDRASTRVAKSGDTMTGNLSIQPSAYPSVNMLYPNVKWWGMQIRENGWLYFPEDNLANFNIAFTPGGNIWSNAFGGFLTDRIESRANAYAAGRQSQIGQNYDGANRRLVVDGTMFIQGTAVVALDGQGDSYVAFPWGFNRCDSVVVCNGDAKQASPYAFGVRDYSPAGFVVRADSMSGRAAGQTVRVHYTAMGY